MKTLSATANANILAPRSILSEPGPNLENIIIDNTENATCSEESPDYGGCFL